MKNLNITKNINIIESLKGSVLYKIADLYQYQSPDGELTDKADTIADLIILLYLLAEKMGYPCRDIDINIRNRLKSGIKKDDGEWREELKLLLMQFEEKKDERRKP